MKKYVKAILLICAISFLLALILDIFTHRFFWLSLISFNQHQIARQFTYRKGQFVYDIILNFSLIQILLPVLVTIMAFKFYRYLKTINQFQLYREKSMRFAQFREINYAALGVAVAIFLAFILYCIFAYLLDGREVVFNSPYLLKRPLFLDWGWGNFEKHHFLRYLFIEKFFAYGLLPYAYGIFGCSLVLRFRHRIFSVFSPIFYYYFFIIIAYPLMKLLPGEFIYFMPSTLLGIGDYESINTSLLLVSSFAPFVLGLIIFYFYQRNVKEV